MIDVLNLKLRFVTDVLTERSGSLSEWSSFILLVRKHLFYVSTINRFYVSI